MATWRELINGALDGDVLIANTLTEEEMDEGFYAGYGDAQGRSFTAWSETRVYFPAVYDGQEWVSSAPRNPSDEVCDHVGGY